MKLLLDQSLLPVSYSQANQIEIHLESFHHSRSTARHSMKILRFLLLFVSFIPLVSAQKMDRPNVLFILADDLGRRDLSVEGSSFYESPNIDRIANEGVRFTNGYATCQVCSPSRASIMLGKYPARIDITDWIGAKMGGKMDSKHTVASGDIQSPNLS